MSHTSQEVRQGQYSFPSNIHPGPPTGHVASGNTPSYIAIPIIETPAYLERLKSLVHNEQVLAAAGYVVKELSSEDLEMKKRCSGCGKPMSRFVPRNKKKGTPTQGSLRQARVNPLSHSDTAKDNGAINVKSFSKGKPRMRCKFHSGHFQLRVWSCCGGSPTDPPCTEREFHVPKFYSVGAIEKLWQYHPTPGGQKASSYRKVVALDCEMGTARSGDCELIRVTLLDYFSGHVLVDKLVYPDVPMRHFNTRYSGVRPIDMDIARRAGTCLYGRNGARNAIWKFVGPSTVVVGHSVQHDLTSLRWIHHTVVDTYILESALMKKAAKVTNAPLETGMESLALSGVDVNIKSNTDAAQKQPKGEGPLSLKKLSKVKLGREIQSGRNGHDSVEDALAARDLIHAYLTA